MPLNKLENFIKNTEGRILYVNPNDLDATDGVENQGNSMTKPFKTLQRALIEAARFSYLRGNDNDITEKTTILLFPGEHVIDNRPGYSIYNASGVARTVSPGGTESFAQDQLTLTLDSNFDLTQSNNILYKFNSVNGGVIVPRGTSVVGLDLRKTKIRPKYVPNPTDSAVPNSAIFRITGACYFWQFTIFDGSESTLVYTDPQNFSSTNQARPTFSHHKLTGFEYADGVNNVGLYGLTDLDMYYSKVSNAFNRASNRDIDQKFPEQSGGFAKQRPEWEIVGAFASDPINISSIISGDGATPGSVVTVTTSTAHGFNADTPIKIRGVNVDDYNISTKVQNVINTTSFTYLLPYVRDNLPAGSSAGLSGSSATATIETDTVSGASPYVFNCSLRSVWGMNGMHADGSKASGFRSMVVAQYTAVSLQKDDRAFVSYNEQNRTYDGLNISKVTGSLLSSGSSSTNTNQVYHLDSNAVYRTGWKPVHIKASNDSFIQIVSVFAIGFNKHFEVVSGGDASITNSNSNFGQVSLSAEGFKKEAFDKDNKAYITSIITPRAIVTEDTQVEWVQIDARKTYDINKSNHLYLYGYTKQDQEPPIISQGYRIGAKLNDTLYVPISTGVTVDAKILMVDNVISTGTPTASGATSGEKNVSVTTGPTAGNNSRFTIDISTIPLPKNGEKIRLISDTGDLPENIEPNITYYAITEEKNASRADGVSLAANQIQIAASKTNADATTPVCISAYGGIQLRVLRRVCDRSAGEIGSPIQWDPVNSAWFVHVESSNTIFSTIRSSTPSAFNGERTEISYVNRKEDGRSIDERLYKVRVVVPKELTNGRDPVDGFVIQDSSSTGVRSIADFNLTDITSADYLYNRNSRFITTCSYEPVTAIVTVLADQPHNLKVNDQIIVKNVTSTTNTAGTNNYGYNGTFNVSEIVNDKSFKYSTTDAYSIVHSPGSFTNDTNSRTVSLPRFERSNLRSNFYTYRTEVITPYIYNVQDGVYYVYMLNSSNNVEQEFTDLNYNQNIVDLYPQLDKDNFNDNPTSAKTYAKRSPLGDIVTSDLKKSITRETIDKFYYSFDHGKKITTVSSSPTSATLTFDIEHQLSGIAAYSSLSGGSGHTNGTYYNVKLFNSNAAPSSATWDGATATVTVSGGVVSSAQITSGGSGYTDGETLYFDSSKIGGTPQANITIATVGISTVIGDVVQVTGIGTTAGGYYRITAASNKYAIAIAKTSGDSTPVVGQYVIHNGPSIKVSTASYNSTTQITTFTCSEPHGLVIGNAFRIIDSSNNNLGDYIVNDAASITQFTSKTSRDVSTSVYVLKHALSANSATADGLGENLGTRGLSVYGKEVAILGSDITTESEFSISLRNSGIGTTRRFELGSYIQIDNEIMRITSSALSGAGNNKIKVIRGSMGTLGENHSNGSLIRKIKLTPIQFHRPSILRASGHTFEYLGYGPGNYSTGLPQVQVKTITEREDFLAQSQETSCGNVIYTGMNSNGDVFNGNTKTSAASGQIVSYDIPKPTVTGEDPNRLSVVFDEVIVKERLLVEGGNSGTILSQFNGPITFNGELRMNQQVVINNNLRTGGRVEVKDKDATQSTNCTTGALVVTGGVGISKNLNVCGSATIAGSATITGATTLSSTLGVTGATTLSNTLNVTGATTLSSTLNISGNTTGSTLSFGSGNLTFNGSNNLAVGHASPQRRLHVVGAQGAVASFPTLGPYDTAVIENNNACHISLVANGSLGGSALKFYKSGSSTAEGLVFYEHSGSGTSNDRLGFGFNNVEDGGWFNRGNKGLYVIGDITAFVSDERLKTNIKPLENALGKVLSLSGFTYNFNEVGQSLGFSTETLHVGVSAQQVQAVLPEAVVAAPASKDYLTVKYEKIVPLLIEAIKELSQKVSDLEDKLNK